MKWIVCGLCAIALVVLMCCAPLFGGQSTESEYLRIHIRANSNSAEDQRVKYMVKDAIVEALIPVLAEAQTKQQAMELVEQNFSLINSVADEVLTSEGFSYSSRAVIKKEEFPVRTYENLTLPAGEYDALIVSLGSGEGNNWWCLVYPAFCFTKTSTPQNVKYVSKIKEIVDKIRNKA